MGHDSRCVTNLPFRSLGFFLEVCNQSASRTQKLANMSFSVSRHFRPGESMGRGQNSPSLSSTFLHPHLREAYHRVRGAWNFSHRFLTQLARVRGNIVIWPLKSLEVCHSREVIWPFSKAWFMGMPFLKLLFPLYSRFSFRIQIKFAQASNIVCTKFDHAFFAQASLAPLETIWIWLLRCLNSDCHAVRFFCFFRALKKLN